MAEQFKETEKPSFSREKLPQIKNFLRENFREKVEGFRTRIANFKKSTHPGSVDEGSLALVIFGGIGGWCLFSGLSALSSGDINGGVGGVLVGGMILLGAIKIAYDRIASQHQPE